MSTDTDRELRRIEVAGETQNTLLHRVMTALLMAIVAIAVLIWSPAPIVCVIFAAIVLLCAWEWSRLCRLTNYWARLAFVAVLAAVMAWTLRVTEIFANPYPAELYPALQVTVLFWLAALLICLFYPRGSQFWCSPVIGLICGALVLLPAWLAFCLLRISADGLLLTLYILTLVSFADIGALFVGRSFGRHKMLAKVSPGKSWEGFCGGLFGVLLIALPVSFFQTHMSFISALGIALAAFLFGIVGDLFESVFKRHSQVKNSGELLPGHGGLMDRMDSISAATPVFACLWLGH